MYFTVGKETPKITYTTDPADGSEVAALKDVTIDYNIESIGPGSGMIEIRKDGEKVARVDAEIIYQNPDNWDEVSHKAKIPVNVEEKGVYTIVIPEGYFCYESGDPIPEVTLTYYVGVASGIQNIDAEIAKGAVYNLNGVKVNKATKGIYIVNGKKVAKK